MKKLLISLMVAFCCLSSYAADEIDNSLLLEARSGVDKAIKYLVSTQLENGAWGPQGGAPAFTALATSAIASSPNVDKYKAVINKAENYLLTFAQPDGSIWDKSEKGYPNYTTSLSMVALYLANKERHKAVLLKARNFLKNSQFEAGGIGYGSNNTKSDLSNSQLALEALFITNDLEAEASPEDIKTTRECWERANKFISRCQALPTSNDLEWAKTAPGEDIGGFVYSPDRSMVVGQEMRVYGSMTYAGLKSMIYAGYMMEDKLIANDPRVKAAVEWAAKNFKVDENPGMGAQGYFYYLQTMSKALDAYAQPLLNDKGENLEWRKQIVKQMLKIQKADGQWVNENGRWMENIPEIVTAYTILTINHALSKNVN
jgi:squalene-hopene/tetraprenyl-beta-curcumene cyclase